MKLILETITPVHIGSGEDIEPYEYVIKDNKLYKINLEKFILSLDIKDREKFVHISAFDMVQTRNFIRENANLQYITEYSIDVDSMVRNIYEKKIGDYNNVLSIRTFINTLNRYIIPGSSTKGAIRTAILFSMATKPISDTYNIEKNVFKYRNPHDDPFRCLSISDSYYIDANNMCVYSASTYTRKDKFVESGYKILFEGTKSYYTNIPVTISQDIFIDDETKKNNNFINIDRDNIISSCNSFYGEIINNELLFFNREDTRDIYDRYKMLKSDLSSSDERSFIMRFGWGTGYNTKTINLAKSVPESKKSRYLIHDELPLGWVKAKIIE
jgi:CRISPR-associated protein Csm5